MQAAATRPVWNDAVAVAETHAGWQVRHAPSSLEVDVAIVGGGLSGLWTAYYLSSLLPSARIAVVEARRVGFGASGRNGGWCSGFFPLTPSELGEQFGAQAGLAAYHESFRTLDEIERVLTAERIDCAWHRGGTIQSASTVLQAERLQALVAAQHAAGLTTTDLQWLPAARVGEHLCLAETHGAVYSPHCATVNPFALVLGLARVLRDRGVRIFEESTVRSMTDGVVSHEHGSLRANLVVLVTEGVVRLGLRKNGWFQADEELVRNDDVPAAVHQHGAHHGSSWREHVAMQAAIRNGASAEVSLHDGLMSVAIGEAAHRSIAEGRPIAMSEVLG
ncbi:MAG: FAD-dependent oxidoreductase [Actinomycetota bacterium]